MESLQEISAICIGSSPTAAADIDKAAVAALPLEISLSQSPEQRRILPDIYEFLFPDVSCQKRQVAAGKDISAAGDEDETPAC